jgi:hypothetical protein
MYHPRVKHTLREFAIGAGIALFFVLVLVDLVLNGT